MDIIHSLSVHSVSSKSKTSSQQAATPRRCCVITTDTAMFGSPQTESAELGLYQNDLKNDSSQVWAHLRSQCQQSLQKDCEGITLKFADSATGQLPALETDGVQIIISKGFLERLTATKEAYNEGCALIKDLWSQLQQVHQGLNNQNDKTGISSIIATNGDVKTTLFSITPQEKTPQDDFTKSLMEGKMVTYYKEKGGRNVTEIKTKDGTVRIVITKRLGYRPGKDLARLAQVSSVGNVRMLSAGVQSAIRRAKSDRYLDEDEVRQAVAQMEGVVRRAKTKINQLRREEILEQRAHQAAKQGERKHAIEMARELKRQRTRRIAKEYAQIHQTDRCLAYRFAARSPHDEGASSNYWPGYGPVNAMSMETSTNAPVVTGSLDQSV